jgi:hypothetical protein
MEARLTTGEIQTLREHLAEHRLAVDFHVEPHGEDDHADVQLVLQDEALVKTIQAVVRRTQRLRRKVKRT